LFCRSTQWLLTRRVEIAKEKLRYGRLALSDIALACGFADESHRTRVFMRTVGPSPSAWRRRSKKYKESGRLPGLKT
jgi:AraC family transcriptional regulator